MSLDEVKMEPAAETAEVKKPAAKPKVKKGETSAGTTGEPEAPVATKKGKKSTIEDVIAVIKNMTVLELAEMVKALETEFGVRAAAPVAAAVAAPVSAEAAPAVEEKTEFTVTLKEIGPNKINVIKAVRELTSLGLKESKDLVESAPKAVKEGVSKEEANTVKQKLEAAGATVEIK